MVNLNTPIKKASQDLGVPFDLGQIRRAPGFEIPDIEGTEEGWRAWVVEKRLPEFGVSPKMKSVVWNYTWYAMQTAEADACGKHTPAGNTKGCTCGFYSAKTLAHLMSMGYHSYADYDAATYFKVIGRVAVWGQVTEGTQGWRSQYAYPVLLCVPYEAHHLAKPLQEAWGCKVRLLNFLKEPGALSQVDVIGGKIEDVSIEKPKQRGRRCHHKAMPFEGYLCSEPWEQGDEMWVEVRWDARPNDAVKMRMSNLKLDRVK